MRDLLSYLRQDPDAVALALLCLLVGGTLVVGLLLGRRRDRQRAAGGSGDPPRARALVPTWPYLIRLELCAALATLILLAWWAIALEPPLAAPADPSFTPTLAKAPWFFVGVQEMLQYFDAWLAGVVLPLLSVLGLCALPYLDRDPEGSGEHRLKGRGAALVALAAILGLWLLPAVVGLFLRGESWRFAPVWRAAADASLELTPVGAIRSLGEVLGLGPSGASLLGAVVCLGPFALAGLAWPRLRRRPAIERLGLGRYLISAGLVLCLLGVTLKVALGVTLGVRYFWITPWFRV
jgi:hypothetical protein